MDDVVFGMVVLGCLFEINGIEMMVGLFINIILVWVKVDWDVVFVDVFLVV